MKTTQELELNYQRNEFDRLIHELEYQKLKWEIIDVEFTQKMKEIVLQYKAIVSNILVNN